ncbi:MAG: hypothetical protein CMF48_06755 [Legionellales bacterium]|nr:hypothetical protein [Legionellales bacterium]|tara:strand:+ start:896 stop:2743 length:1848 start_codon:yes stop_codon:yes gene_type:complete
MGANFNQTLQGKVVYVVLLTCFVSLLVTSAAFVSYEWYALKNNQETELKHITHLLTKQLKRSLDMGNKEAARQELDILQALPTIESAYLFSAQQSLFAYYRRSDEHHALPANFAASQDMLAHTANFQLPVEVNGKMLGTLVLVSDLDPVHEILKGFGLKALITLLLALFIAYLLGDRLKKTITEPIIELTKTTRKIANEQSYHLRVDMVDIEELGQLIDSFNHMLSVISTRSAEVENIKNYLYEMIDAIDTVMIGVDSDLQVVYFNESGCKLAHQPLERIIGESLFSTLPFVAFQEENIRACISEHQSFQSNRFIVEQNGVPHTFMLSGYPLHHETGAVLLLQDITDNIAMENRLIQNEKMLSLGGMAAGMAHEINNPLGGVMQGAQNIERRLDLTLPANQNVARKVNLEAKAFDAYLEERQIKHFLSGIRRMGERMAKIIQTMLQFAKGTAPQQSVCSIDLLLNSAMEVARSTKHLHGVTINTLLDSGLPAIRCSSTEIQQVFVNLILNAAQAMQNQSSPVPTLTISVRQEDKEIVFEFKDNGPGIPEQAQNRIFEPFYTTKQEGKGTGLGMSLSYFIVCTRHGGQMTLLKSTPKGTVFQIRLPVSGLSSTNAA